MKNDINDDNRLFELSNSDFAPVKGEPIRQRELKGEHTLGNPTHGAANFANFRPGIIELIEHTEVPVIRKEARVVEEVSIRKIVEAHESIIQDSVRHTEMDIQRRNQDDAGFNQ